MYRTEYEANVAMSECEQREQQREQERNSDAEREAMIAQQVKRERAQRRFSFA